MSRWSLEALTAGRGELVRHPLPISAGGGPCRLRVRSLPGSTGVHLPCFEGAIPRRRFEVAAGAEETFSLELELDADGELHAWSENRVVFGLPGDERFAPPAPTRQPASGGSLEVIWVIDGTMRCGQQHEHKLLLGSDLWPEIAARLAELGAELAAGRPAQMSILAFGDEPFPMLAAPDLKPDYRLWPPSAERGELPWFAPDELGERLAAVPSTSGGDFVDALADALALCAALPLREGARRIVAVVGESPGHSLTDPAPDGADLLPRAREIEEPAMELHRLGALIATFYHDNGAATEASDWALRRDLPEHARRQYRSLASMSSLAFSLHDCDPRGVAEALRRLPALLARGCAFAVVDGELGVAAQAAPRRARARAAKGRSTGKRPPKAPAASRPSSEP